jgi:hypothetical protein
VNPELAAAGDPQRSGKRPRRSAAVPPQGRLAVIPRASQVVREDVPAAHGETLLQSLEQDG